MISALSPLDGRYANKVGPLCAYFSEEALIKARVIIEVQYFRALAQESKIKDLPKLSSSQSKALDKLIDQFGSADAKAVKTIEKKTNHDVKAVEYFLKKNIGAMPGLKKHTEFIHFGLTSEDTNNLSYGIMVHSALDDVIEPELTVLVAELSKLAKKWNKVALLSLTHGQPATPTTLGKEIAVYVDRLNRQLEQLRSFQMQGKFGGAVATYSAHRAAYPKVNWEAFGNKFVTSLGMEPMDHATQINPHDDIAELSHLMSRINTILLDLSRDMWMYIMRGVFKQKVIKGEVGSSTMPHKVNPIDFENAEGNVGISSALFTHFAEKLPVSRLQRDLSDSTVQRNIGTAFGYHMIAVSSLSKGLSKITLDTKKVKQELEEHPEVLAEAIQMILRRKGVEGAYEKLKEVTRGESISVKDLDAFMKQQKFSDEERKRVLGLI